MPRPSPSRSTAALAAAACLGLGVGLPGTAAASSISVLTTFTATDGYPVGNDYVNSSVLRDFAGNIYGATTNGAHNQGQIYQVSPSVHGAAPVKTILHDFFADSLHPGAYLPSGALVFDKAGNIWGTAQNGGANAAGALFELTKPATVGGSWTYRDVFDFPYLGSSSSPGPFLFDAVGNIYGVTQNGNYNSRVCGTTIGCGTIYRLLQPKTGSTVWRFQNLAQFNPDPYLNVPINIVRDTKGNLYGTNFGGPNPVDSGGGGEVWQLSPPTVAGAKWSLKTIFAFGGSRGPNGEFTTGYYPQSGVVVDVAGHLFGTTRKGGPNYYDDGTLYELTPPVAAGQPWGYSVLHGFLPSYSGGVDKNGVPEGAQPTGIKSDSTGNLYVVASKLGICTNVNIGPCGTGTIDMFAAGTWALTIIYSFPPQYTGGPFAPNGGFARDLSGNLYGTTSTYGFDNVSYGSLFKVTP